MIFADSGFFIGLWDPDDARHADAELLLRKLQQAGWLRGLHDLMTCQPMACETAEHLSHTLGARGGANAYSRVMNNCQVIRPSERDVQLALDRIFRLYLDIPHKKRRPGLVDCIGIAVMRRFNVLRLLSFDRGFDVVPDVRRIRVVGTGPSATFSIDRA
jgi:predicted nucleic acid-binding protein